MNKCKKNPLDLSDVPDIREAVLKLIDLDLANGTATEEECDEARRIIVGSDEWMRKCGSWRLIGSVRKIIEFGHQR